MELKTSALEKIKKALGEENVFENEIMADHLTMKVGGPARYYFTPENEGALIELLDVLSSQDCPYYVLGNGSNVIVRDEGYDGAIINMVKGFGQIDVSKDLITAGAGASLKDVSERALEEALTGFEFACGIPGSVGGACSMNAGAYGGEIKDVALRVRTLTRDGEAITFSNEDMKFGYRHSVCSDSTLIVTKALFKLEKGDPALIKAKMDELTKKRQEKQPLEYPSCGSTFKRPEGYFAGKLIMDSGLKGVSVGGAQVSEKHCGFVINKGNATAKDVLELIDLIKKTVYEKQGVELECEVKIL